mgnify:FL=1
MPEIRLSVVTPCYRSQATLPLLVAQLHQQLGSLCAQYEIILVVDGSPDDTAEVARQLAAADPERVRAVVLRRNYGQHNALMAGIARARFPIVVTMDDDLQHRPDQVSALIAPLADPDVDLVYGVAEVEEHGIARSAASRMVKAGLAASGVENAGHVSAFRAFRRELRDGWSQVDDPFVSLDVVLSWATTSVRAVPVRMDQRAIGTSAYTFSRLMRHTWNMVTGYGTLPLRIVTWIGVALSFLGFAALVVVIVAYVSGSIEVAGFTSTIALIALFNGAILLSLGILGEYLGRLHFRSMHRPGYLVRSDSGDHQEP